MPFNESQISVDVEENPHEIGPFDVNSPEKLERYLSLKESFDNDFDMERGEEEELIDKLNENDQNILYRGMSPKKIFQLINGDPVKITPYRYEDVDSEKPPEEDVQNASFKYSNVIMHGYDPVEDYDFLSAVGFSPEGFYIQKTGDKMVKRFIREKEFEIVPSDREEDITIEGVLEPEKVSVYTFRFREGKKI